MTGFELHINIQIHKKGDQYEKNTQLFLSYVNYRDSRIYTNRMW